MILLQEERRPVRSSVAGKMESSDTLSPIWQPKRQEYLIMLTVTFISIMVALDATILVCVLPTLATQLEGTAEQAFWTGTSYLLASAVVQPLFVDLSDIFGRRQLLQTSIVFFTVGSLVCARANSFPVLLTGRSLKGVGGGGIITLGQALFADIVPLRQRAKWFAMVLIAWALGSVLGPFIGGLIVQYSTWRWCFYLNLPFCGIGLILVHLFVRFQKSESTFRNGLSQIDWLGNLAFIIGLTSFLMGISWAGVQYPWSSFKSVVPIVAGVVGVLLSLLWQRYGARHPFLRMSLFSSTSAIAAYICAFGQGMVLYLGLYYIPFFFMAVLSASPVQAGINMFAVTSSLLPSSAIISLLITRLGRFRWALYLGWTVKTLASGLNILIPVKGESIRTAEWASILVVTGLGSGIVLTSVNFATQSIAKSEDCARAASMYAFFRSMGLATGVAIGGTVFQNLMSRKLAQLSQPTEIARHAESFLTELQSLDPDDPARIAILEAYNFGFQGIYIVMTAISGIGLLSSLLIRSHSMDKLLDSKHKIER